MSCNFGQSGIEPPTDRIFFPAGLAVDPAGQWLYVVNSNSDLRFNAGTVVAVNLPAAEQDRQAFLANPAATPRCANSVFVQPQNGATHFCCADFVDSRILDCDERFYVAKDATVRTGSFGGTILVQKTGDKSRRLFVAVRAEPSLTFVDATVDGAHVSMNCAKGSPGGNAFCTDDFRIKGMMQAMDGTQGTQGMMNATDNPYVQFPEEPHDMTMDEQLGVLYVAHLGGVQAGVRISRGVSVVSICPNERPALASVLNVAFPNSIALGVRSLTSERPGDAAGTLLATSENTTEIAELVYNDRTRVGCQIDAKDRDLTLDAGRRFVSSAFGTRTGDLRGIELTEGGKRAYVLHHQWAVGGEYNPASVVEIDRSPDARGQPVNEPLGVVDVCNGPNRLLQHDAGRGLRLFVNCFENGQIYVVDPELLNVESIIELGAGPAELVFAPGDPTVAFVAGFANNNVSVLDLKPGSPTEYRVVQRIGFARPSAYP